LIELTLGFLAAMCFLALTGWRRVFALCVATALLQDPLRNMLPGQPFYLLVFVGIVFAAGFFGAMMARVPLRPGGLMGWRQFVERPFLLFAVLVLFQGIRSLATFESPVVAAIGFMSYFAPLPAVLLAYRFALDRGEAGILGWMRLYVVMAILALVTVYMEYSGVGFRAFGEVGGGVLISGQGAYYRGNSGIFRAAEIAAWHAAAVGCFAFVLFWGRHFSPPRVLLALVLIAFLLGIGALTGRRKMVIEVMIFLSAYFCLVGWFQKGNARAAVIVAMLGIVAYMGVIGLMAPDRGDSGYASEQLAESATEGFEKYSDRAKTVFQDLPRRVSDTGIQPIVWAVQGAGWLGGGLGIGRQGLQHFGAQDSGAAEGGLGKITVELGIPGLLLALWLAWSFAKYIWRVLGVLAKLSPAHSNLACGIVAFIIANVATFIVATQAYADIFILLTLGWSFGFLVALPVLAERRLSEHREARVVRAAAFATARG
jgi:hypothetical protein